MSLLPTTETKFRPQDCAPKTPLWARDKTIMKKYFSIILILLITQLAAQGADQAGWNKVQWGMTPQQITQVYPEAQALTKPVQFTLDGESFTATIGIERFDLAGGAYKVRFLIDSNNTLGGVILVLDNPSNRTTDAGTLEKLLVQKYGPSSNEIDLPGGGRSVSWSHKGVTITLRHLVRRNT